MSVPEPQQTVLGPLFTAGLALGVYGLVRRRRGALALAAAAILADRTPAGRRLAESLRPPT